MKITRSSEKSRLGRYALMRYLKLEVISIAFLLSSFSPEAALSQACSPINMELTSQQQIDEFQANYGPCDRVGNMLIQGDDITNLDGLANLTSVGTFLRIENNPVLVNLNGLSSLSVVSRLSVEGNSMLLNLSGLSRFEEILSVYISDNPSLTSLDGLSRLKQVTYELIVENNALLANLEGLSGLTSVGHSLVISENPSLKNLDVFRSLTSLGRNAESEGGGSLSISNNDSLVQLFELSSLSDFNGNIHIYGNNSLLRLSGLSGIGQARGIDIRHNPLLRDLSGLNVSGYLSDHLVIDYNAALTNIDALSGITHVGEQGLSISGNDSLANLDGLNNVETIEGTVYIQSNNLMSDVDGLAKLNAVGGDFRLTANAILGDCASLAKLLDQVDHADPGPGPGEADVPDVGGNVRLSGNQTQCNSVGAVLRAANGISNGELELVGEFGQVGQELGDFIRPFGVIVDSNQRVVVADGQNHRIQTCSVEGDCSAFGSAGTAAGEFYSPTGIAEDRKGQIIVADYGNSRVQICSPDGDCRVLEDADGVERRFDGPLDVAVTPAGQIVITEPERAAFHVCTAGGDCQTFDDLDGEPNLFVRPEMVAVDRDGWLFFTTSLEEIWRCDQKGSCDYLFGSRGTEPGQFSSAKDLVVDDNGNLIIADTNNWRLQICTVDGACSVHEIWQTSEQLMYWPTGVDLMADGRIVISDREGHKIQIYRVVGQNTPINAGHAGAWFWPTTTGQGQFIDVEPTNQFMFIGWFTYTEAGSDNPNEQQWYTAQGNYSGNTAVLDLHETLGGKFRDPQEVTTTKVGTVMLEFDDCQNGTMSYQFDTDGPTGDFPLVRVIPGSENWCQDLEGSSPEAVDINHGMDGAWYDSNMPGQGFYFDVHTDTEGEKFIFVSWFTYGGDTASGQRWLTAQGNFEGSMAAIDVHETTGGSFDDPKEVETVKVGTMTIDFADCETAELSYVLDEGLEGTIDITRVVPGGQALCEEFAGLE